MKYENTTPVGADPAQVWDMLSDIERWPERIATYEEVRLHDGGAFRVGSRAHVKQKGLAAGEWEVTELTEGTSFTWSNRHPGVRSLGRHTVTTNADGSTQLTLTLELSGWLAAPMGVLLGRKVREYVDLEAASLKAAAESA